MNRLTTKTIKIGTHNRVQLKKSLETQSCKFGFYGTDFLDHKEFTVSFQEQTIDIVVLSVEQLGYNPKLRKGEKTILQAAFALGLEKCPQEAAFQLCLQHKDQKEKESFIVVSDAVLNLENTECALVASFGKGECDIDSIYYNALADPRCPWYISKYAFLLPKKTN